MGLDFDVRPAVIGDADFIVEMARHACVMEDWPLPAADSEETRSLLPGIGAVAVVAANPAGSRLGAAWTFVHDPPLLVDADGAAQSEIAIAVTPSSRGRGVGGALLDELIQRCVGTHDVLTLNVHERNPAIRLYERKGFQVAGRGRGALGIAMRVTTAARSHSSTGGATSAINDSAMIQCGLPGCTWCSAP